MNIRLYMDVHIPRAITNGLRLREINVLTAQEDGSSLLSDEDLLLRATQLNRVLFTFDDDFLSIASKKILNGDEFPGLIFGHPSEISIGTCVQDLELVSKTLELIEIKNQIIFLPI